MNHVVLPLAHAGEGATWQALLTLLAFGLVVVVALVVFRVVRLDEPGDLILPLAGTAVLASLSGATSAVLSDLVGWAFPMGVVALIALLVASLTPLDLSWTSPLLISAVVVGAVAAVVLEGPIVRAWHPTTPGLGTAPLDDLVIEIVEPRDGATIPPGSFEVVVQATGGTLGEGFVTANAPPDPEQQVGLTITTVDLGTGQNTSFVGVPTGDCSAGCQQATYEVTIEDPGEYSVFVEARTAEGRAFSSAGGANGSPTDSVTITVG